MKKKSPKAKASSPIAASPAPLNDALGVALYAGELLQRNGAETWRIEDTVVRLLTHFGATEGDVIATVTGISVSASDGAQWLTRVRRVRQGGLNLARIDAVNDLSRRAIAAPMSPAQVRRALQAIETEAPLYRALAEIGAGLVTAAGFTPLFGGAWRELLAALPGAFVLSLLVILLPRRRVPLLAATGVASLGGVLVSILCARWLGTGRVDVVVLSTVVLLVPGATIVSALSDLLGGQLLSGLARGANAILISAAIAVGVIIGLAFTGATL